MTLSVAGSKLKTATELRLIKTCGIWIQTRIGKEIEWSFMKISITVNGI